MYISRKTEKRKRKRIRKTEKKKRKEGWPVVFSWKGKNDVTSFPRTFSTFQLCLIEDLVEGKVIVSTREPR